MGLQFFGSTVPLQLKVAGRSDVGLVRTANEDCLHLDEKNRVFAVCDGMGGHQAGEVASMMTADIIDIIFNHFQADIHQDERLAIGHALPLHGEILIKAIRIANRAIFNTAVEKPTLLGMGTTVVALTLDEDLLSVAHVGDSRAYRLAERTVDPLTIDHSWVAEIQQNQNLTHQEAASVVGKNVITRALGVRENVEVDYRAVKVRPGDKFMICSDGLCGFADDDEIFYAMNRVRDDNERIAADLVQLANERGGSDNVTVAVVEVVEADASEASEIPRFTVPAEINEVLTIEDEWLEKLNSFIAHRNESSEVAPPEKPLSRTALLMMFAIFIIIAALIIYFSTGR